MGLSTTAKLYIGGITSAGLAVLAVSSLHWTSADPLRFVVFLLLTALASGVKVSLPGVSGTMSLNLILILAGIIQFTLGEAVDIAIVSALVQCFWPLKERPRWTQVLFTTGLTVASTALADAAYDFWPSDIGSVLSITASACTYFLASTLSVAGAAAVTEHKNFFRLWKQAYFWSFPYYLLAASLAASISFVTRFNWEITLALFPMLLIIYRAYTLHLRQVEEGKRTAEMMAALHLRTIEALALAIEAKDQTTADHLKRVQVYSRELSKDLGLPADQERALQAASILHDVGKIAVPDYIISKPGRLTPEEFAKIKIHPIVGGEIIERIKFPYPVAPIVRAHHEKWDGSGYPFGLRGDEIPIGARILSVVDCFDALASDRQYRKALPLKEAMAVVARESGKSFDPRIVELLGRRYLELEALAQGQPSRDQAQLSVDVEVTRGNSPGAGFEPAIRSSDANGIPQWDHASADGGGLVSLFEDFISPPGISLSLTEALGVLCSRIGTLVPADTAAVYLVEGTWVIPKYVHGENIKLLSSLRIPLGEGLVGWVAANHQAILNGNPVLEPGYRSVAGGGRPLHSALAIPLETVSGTLGVLALYRTEKDAFSRRDVDCLLAVADKISMAAENTLQQEHRKSHLNVDAMTGLPNVRALFANISAEIAKRQTTGSALTILLCGMEGVTTVHESFGRSAAEEAIRFVAESFRQTCRESEYLAWRGEDEFVFVLPGAGGEAAEARVGALKRIVREASLQLWTTDLLSLTAAVVEFPFHGDSPAVLIAEAKKRMLAARKAEFRTDADSAFDSLVQMSSSVQADTRTAPVAGR